MASAKTRAFKPFVVLFGGSDFHLDRDVERVRAGNRDVLTLDGEGLKDHEVVGYCDRYFDSPTTIILENAHLVKGSNSLTSFVGGHDGTNTSLVLVAVFRSEKKLPSHWSLAIQKGKGVERPNFKPWDTRKYLDFIRKEATSLRVLLGKNIPETLLEYVGTDLYRLSNELRKLAAYVGQDRSIERKHVALVTSPTPKAEPYQVAEAVLMRKYNKAIRLLAILQLNLGDGSLIPLTRALMKQVERSVVIKTMQGSGSDEDEIAAYLGMKLWPYRNSAAPIANKHSLQELVGYMGLLCKLDVKLKGSSSPVSKRTLVETTLLAIAN